MYGPLIEGSLEEEAQRKVSLEQRSIAVITTSGILVSLLVALIGLLGKDATPTSNASGRVLLVVGLCGFVVAALLGLIANAPKKYSGFGTQDFKRMVEEWQTDRSEAEVLVADFQVAVLAKAERLNNIKGRTLQGAVACEVIGVAAVAGAAVTGLF